MHLGTYLQIIRSIFPDSFITMKLLRFINYTYKIDSIKNMARQKRGTSPAKVNITGFEQNMPQGNNWQEFLKDSEYKDPLIEDETVCTRVRFRSSTKIFSFYYCFKRK